LPFDFCRHVFDGLTVGDIGGEGQDAAPTCSIA